MSPEESYESQRRDLMDLFTQRHPDAPVPSGIDLIRFVLPEEWAPTMVECLQSAGFSASVLDDGGIAFGDVPTEQAEALDLANLVCNLQYPLDPKYSSPLTAYQIEYLFEYYVYDLIPCLEDSGFPIPDPPSRQQFIEDYDTSEGWSPYSFVQAASEESWTELNRACPQTPDDLFG